jgi:hypothetical protein
MQSERQLGSGGRGGAPRLAHMNVTVVPSLLQLTKLHEQGSLRDSKHWSHGWVASKSSVQAAHWSSGSNVELPKHELADDAAAKPVRSSRLARHIAQHRESNIYRGPGPQRSQANPPECWVFCPH